MHSEPSYKRLERDRFPWPDDGEKTIVVGRREIAWLLDGIDFFRLRPHEEIFYESTL